MIIDNRQRRQETKWRWIPKLNHSELACWQAGSSGEESNVQSAIFNMWSQNSLPLPLVSFPSFSLLPTPNRPCQSERSSKARHEADSFFCTGWVVWATNTWAVGLARRCRRRFDPRSRSLSLSSTSKFSSLSSTSQNKKTLMLWLQNLECQNERKK